MKYFDGREVRLGDKVRLDTDDGGIVVAIIDTDEYMSGYSSDTWSYLKRGALISFPKFGLIHYEVPDEDVEFIERGER